MWAMTRKGKLWLMTLVFALGAGGLGLWAGRIHNETESVQGYYYTLTGYSYRAASEMASADAAQASGPVAIGAWVLAAAALVAAIMAVALRSSPVSAERPN